MDAGSITALVQSVRQAFRGALGAAIDIQPPTLERQPRQYQVVGIVPMLGGQPGNLMMCLPHETAMGIVRRLASVSLGLKDEAADASLSPYLLERSFADRLGELLRLVRERVGELFPPGSTAGSPMVILGAGQAVMPLERQRSVTIPCRCALGEFELRVVYDARPASSIDAKGDETTMAKR